jgi:glutamyl/glutaminyl-tRNA synthetase
MFELDPPEFAHLPLLLNNKGQKLSKRFGDVSVGSYKEKGFLPEALMNSIALLGWNPPHREDPTVLSESTGVFLKHEVMRIPDMVQQFNLDKISKSGAKFDIEKLLFFNSMHIRSRFQYTPGNSEEITNAVRQWRMMLKEEMPKDLGKQINQMSDSKMKQVMDMMKVRLRYMSDIRNH